jgi:hypothetical protein
VHGWCMGGEWAVLRTGGFGEGRGEGKEEEVEEDSGSEGTVFVCGERSVGRSVVGCGAVRCVLDREEGGGEEGDGEDDGEGREERRRRWRCRWRARDF